MDPTEDLSARVLLKHILITEPPRTPVTRSNSQALGTSGLRRSSRRRSRKDVEPQTPQDILRRSLKHKIRESVTRKSLPSTKRTSSVLKKLPAAVSMPFSAEDTPRHLLRNILQTEPVKSPVVHEKGHPEEPQPPSADKTVAKTRSSIELSGLDLPDITIGSVASIAKGLSRKRPRRSLNVTAFEKRLKDGNEAEEETDISSNDHSSLSLSSGTSLSLKTPFADVRTEKRGLQRKVSNRRKITEEEFGAAVSRRQTGDVFSHDLEEKNLCEVTNSEGFTLGLSKLSEPDITTDILNCNTALYDQPDAMTSNFSILATQEKPTVMASQLQRDMGERELEEERSEMKKDRSVAVSPNEEDCISDSRVQEHVAEAEPQKEEGRNQSDDIHGAEVGSESEEEEDAVESKAGGKGDEAESEQMEAQTEEEGATNSNAEQDDNLSENEEVSPSSQTEEDVEKKELAADSHSEDAEKGSHSDKEVYPDSQTEEEEVLSETEQHTADSRSEDVEEGSHSKEEGAADSQTEEVAESSAAEDAVEVGSQSEDDEDVAESQTEDEYNEQRGEEEQALEQLEHDFQHISRRAHRSEGTLILPAARWTNDKSKAHSALGLNTSAEIGSRDTSQPQTEKPDLAESSVKDHSDVSCSEHPLEAEEEKSLHRLGATQDVEVNEHESGHSPEEVPAQDSADQEEEWDEDGVDEEVEEVPCKTPAFVREKRNFFHSDPPASPSVFKNIQASGTREALPAAKPKQVRQRRTGTTRKQAVLPKTYLMSVFRHFAKTKVSADVHPVLNEIMDKFFDRVAEDLETFAAHAKRKTIEVEDVKLLLKRQGYVNDKVPVEVLIEKYLRLEQRKLLIPIATSGNVVIPKVRR